MGSKESGCRVPKDAMFMRNQEGSIVGIATNDASFDYSQEGQKFLQSGAKDIQSKAYPTGIIYPGSRR